MSYLLSGLGAATAERLSSCESYCAEAFTGSANKRSKCTAACIASVNSGNCDGQCNPAFSTGSNRLKCYLACKKSWLPPLVSAVLPDVIPAADEGGSATSSITKNLPLIAIVGGLGLVAYFGWRAMKKGAAA